MNKRKFYAWSLVCIMLLQIILPTTGFALTGGATQPEFSAFNPIGTTDMVSLPDGGFQYNIPLLDVGGYPLNLSYHSGITADMEAPSTGLGWSVNSGVINRNVRAIPDDFKGENVTKEFNMKSNWTIGSTFDTSMKVFGLEEFLGVGLKSGIFYNSYEGLGIENGISAALKAGEKGGSKLTLGMGLNFNSQNGMNFSSSLNYSAKIFSKDGKALKIGGGIGLSVNSREGLVATNISSSIKEETKNASAGTYSSAKYSFATKTFIPQINMPQNNYSLSVNISPTGAAMFGANSSMSFSGYISGQHLRDKRVSKKAFGLLYAHEGFESVHSLMDFHREKESAFYDYSVNLPIVNSGGDVLSLSGQGISGSYMPKRSDVPIFFDTKSTAVGNGGSLGAEFGTGGLFHGGVDVVYNNTNSFSGKWKDNNPVLKDYNFQTGNTGIREPAYYKAASEMAIESDLEYYNEIGEDKAVQVMLREKPSGNQFDVETVEGKLIDEDGRIISGSNVKRKKRERRNQTISYLTAEEAKKVGLEKKIISYHLNTFRGNQNSTTPIFESLERIDENHIRKPHHISQIESVRADGLRYIYGIPAYNVSQREVSFNVSGRPVEPSTGNVIYQPDIDNNKENKLGKSHYFNATYTPPFAHAYLLTAVLGQDYEDKTGDGPSEDDHGNYTHFKYHRSTDDTTYYNWRVPFEQNSANYNAGLFSVEYDDTGSYISGAKEIWLPHSIESKTMIAEFYYEDRLDGYGVKGENGGIASINQNKKLVRIELYSKKERFSKKEQAIPIKSVHFKYNYELCKDTPNSKAPQGGKLTLKEVYFTYGISKKGKLSSYRFFYKNPSTSYDRKSYDRWGDYMKNTPNPNPKNPIPGSPISNDEFPYTNQDPAIANQNAGTWSLTKIELPSGGTIDVSYEAKHYAYVQNKPAMELRNIVGIKEVGKYELYDLNPSTNASDHSKILFALDDQNISRTELRRQYLKDFNFNKNYIYLKCYVKMNSGGIHGDKWEYVSLYSKIKNYGIHRQNGQNYGFIELNPLEIKDNNQTMNINPISKFSFQFLRQNLPEIAYNQSSLSIADMLNNPIDAILSLSTMASQMISFFVGFNRTMKLRGYAKKIALDRSYIRLTSPDGIKYGGGSMVSKIIIQDNWGSMTDNSSNDFSYGQEYSYWKKDELSGKTISSGVASYEPMIGGDENPFRHPMVVSEKQEWTIDNVHFVEEPFGESMMDAPRVVFSEVKVRNLKHPSVERTGTGHSVMKFYTAKDFPTRIEKTDLAKEPRSRKAILSLLKLKMKEHMNATQGFIIEKNNMHGQAASNEVYDENGTLISKVQYLYKTKEDNPSKLENRVEVIQPSGKVTTGLLGVDYQLTGDAREAKTITTSGGVALNIDGFTIGPAPISIPIPWPQYEASEKRFRSMSMTKVVHKKGVLDRVVAYDLGSTISTENLAWDAETGEVLLTKTFNEFEDPVYNLKLPAHLAYEGMQGAYKNIGYQLNNINITNGKATVPDASVFFPGDELLVYANSNTVEPFKLWVLNRDVSNNTIYLINRIGVPLSGNFKKIKIMRSGRRNIPTAPIQTITSLQNPIQNQKIVLKKNTEILNAGAVEYSNQWQTFCCGKSGENPPQDGYPNESYGSKNNINPFVHNVRGNWKPKKSWLHLSERDRNSLSATPSNTNLRKNGFYTDFSSFWNPNGNRPWRKNPNRWTWTTEVTQINPNGTELENVDKLGRFSAEILGYQNQLVTGVAANSRYQQIAFEGFEDFGGIDKGECANRHFGGDLPYLHLDKITDETAHTGRYSLKVDPSGWSVTTSHPIRDLCAERDNLSSQSAYDENELSRYTTSPVRFKPYRLDDCDCVQGFSPDPGKYVITAWVKEGDGMGATDYKKHALNVQTNSQNTSFKASGNIIEGWQRIEGTFEVQPGDTQIQISFVARGIKPVYFDDLRIFPFNGEMKNFVYDRTSLKLLSEIDLNGFANFYEYDGSGELIRIKKETERGIMTIQESRSALPKQ